ncbi:MAG: PAC2 family protein [Chloroflexi bacterium]|nr:PAC2 family protein [Chloroflexota bacterium]
MALYTLTKPKDLREPVLVAALDGWVDAGSAATTAAGQLAEGGEVVVRFDPDAIFDYRSRRPTLEIVDGRPAKLTWPELTIRRSRTGDRDVLILTGAEPDDRWQQLAHDMVELSETLDVRQLISLGAIPAAVPHTRPVTILGTESEAGLLRADVRPGPSGILRVPSAAISVIDYEISHAGVPSVGYFAQIPHYVSGPYPAAAVELLKALAKHLDVTVPMEALAREAKVLNKRLDAAAAADETTGTYVSRLETMADESRLPSGDDLISDIEKFLRERGQDLGRGGRPN